MEPKLHDISLIACSKDAGKGLFLVADRVDRPSEEGHHTSPSRYVLNTKTRRCAARNRVDCQKVSTMVSYDLSSTHPEK